MKRGDQQSLQMRCRVAEASTHHLERINTILVLLLLACCKGFFDDHIELVISTATVPRIVFCSIDVPSNEPSDADGGGDCRCND